MEYTMPKKGLYLVRLRDAAGRVSEREVFAPDEAGACEVAVRRARAALATMADRRYAEFEIISSRRVP